MIEMFPALARAGAGPVVYGLAALVPQITTRYN